MRKEDVKKGVAVVVPLLQADIRFRDRVGRVLGITKDKYFVGKGTPIVVRFDNGLEPVGFRTGNLSVFTSWPKYSDYYFAADELEMAKGEQ